MPETVKIGNLDLTLHPVNWGYLDFVVPDEAKLEDLLDHPVARKIYEATCNPFAEPMGPPPAKVSYKSTLQVVVQRNDGTFDRRRSRAISDAVVRAAGFNPNAAGSNAAMRAAVDAALGQVDFDVPVAACITPYQRVCNFFVKAYMDYANFRAIAPGTGDHLFLSIPYTVKFITSVREPICDAATYKARNLQRQTTFREFSIARKKAARDLLVVHGKARRQAIMKHARRLQQKARLEAERLERLGNQQPGE